MTAVPWVDIESDLECAYDIPDIQRTELVIYMYIVYYMYMQVVLTSGVVEG